MFFKTNVNNAAETIIQLVDCLGINITKQTIINELELHPNHLTLLSISDVLNQFNIATYPFKDVTMKQLDGVSYPLIAHTNKNNGFVLVKDIKENNVYLYDNILTIDEFNKIFDGIILVIEPLDGAGDINFKKNKQIQFLNSLRNPIFIGGSLILLLTSLLLYTPVLTISDWKNIAAIFFKVCGLSVSILLLMQSIDANNPLIKRLCESGTNKNCTAILSSNAANVFGWLTWSEVGFFYFLGTLLAFVFNSNSLATLQTLAVLNLLCLPYTVYSIYYQARVAKQWCVLCSSIQVILWAEFFPLASQLFKPFSLIDNRHLMNLIICFAIPVLLWVWVKPFLTSSQKIKPLNKQLNKFKYNIELFNKLLQEQPKYAIPSGDWSIVLGNENPDTIVTIVSNPYCGPCIEAHEEVDKLLACRPNMQIRHVFVFNNVNLETDKRMLVARHLLRLHHTNGEQAVVKEALRTWYDRKRKNFADWKMEYPVLEDVDIKDKLQSHLDWCELAEVKSTPTIIVNGYKLPYPYVVGDLKYF